MLIMIGFQVLLGPYDYITQIPGKQIRTKLAVVSEYYVIKCMFKSYIVLSKFQSLK